MQGQRSFNPDVVQALVNKALLITGGLLIRHQYSTFLFHHKETLLLLADQATEADMKECTRQLNRLNKRARSSKLAKRGLGGSQRDQPGQALSVLSHLRSVGQSARERGIPLERVIRMGL